MTLGGGGVRNAEARHRPFTSSCVTIELSISSFPMNMFACIISVPLHYMLVPMHVVHPGHCHVRNYSCQVYDDIAYC